MSSSLKEMTKEQHLQVEKRFLEINGVGINQFMHSLEGDVTKFDQITREPLTKCLAWLTFEKEKNELEAKRNKRLIQ